MPKIARKWTKRSKLPTKSKRKNQKDRKKILQNEIYQSIQVNSKKLVKSHTNPQNSKKEAEKAQNDPLKAKNNKKNCQEIKQAEAELGQAQPELRFRLRLNDVFHV